MDKMGWTVSAKLMRHWFDSPAWSMSDHEREGKDANGNSLDYVSLKRDFPHRVVDDVVKMDWLLGYEHVASALSRLALEWSSPNGKIQLRKRLKSAGWQPEMNFFQLGSPNMSAIELDNSCQVNRRPVGSTTNTFNDYFGAIFMATLKIAVIGHTSYNSTTKKNKFHVSKAGFYLRDTYDFNVGSGLVDKFLGLGVWSKDRLLTKGETIYYLDGNLNGIGKMRNRAMFPGFVQVWNENFKEWSKKHGRGGDFFVFSDVKWETPSSLIPIEIPLE